MDWRQYEKEIENQFKETYPSARITPNAKLAGKFSKVERQIDLLIEEQALDFAFRIIVDAKHRGRKIDVGDVEAFLGMMQDVEAHTGMMVALEGYTPAAINRAYYDNLDVVLDVLSLDELKAFQGHRNSIFRELWGLDYSSAWVDYRCNAARRCFGHAIPAWPHL